MSRFVFQVENFFFYVEICISSRVFSHVENFFMSRFLFQVENFFFFFMSRFVFQVEDFFVHVSIYISRRVFYLMSRIFSCRHFSFQVENVFLSQVEMFVIFEVIFFRYLRGLSSGHFAIQGEMYMILRC